MLQQRQVFASWHIEGSELRQMRCVPLSIQQGEAARTQARFDAVVARALGEPERFYQIASRALKMGGLAILYATQSQFVAHTAARESGLGDHIRIEYRVSRRDERMNRALVCWRKP